MKKKINVEDPNALIPDLPSPEDLKPFPTQVSLDFRFHETCVRSISISPNGLFLLLEMSLETLLSGTPGPAKS